LKHDRKHLKRFGSVRSRRKNDAMLVNKKSRAPPETPVFFKLVGMRRLHYDKARKINVKVRPRLLGY
jgi:hypothetical protein